MQGPEITFCGKHPWQVTLSGGVTAQNQGHLFVVLGLSIAQSQQHLTFTFCSLR